MLEELRKINYIGQYGDIKFFLKDIIGRNKKTDKDIRIIFANVWKFRYTSPDEIISLCKVLELIELNSKQLELTTSVLSFLDDSYKLDKYIISKALECLLNFTTSLEVFEYDFTRRRYILKEERIPLDLSSIRNVLISQRFFEVDKHSGKSKFVVSRIFETILHPVFTEIHKKNSLENLKRDQERREESGRKAEEYVFAYEKNRLTNKSLTADIKCISDIDVGAGFDILSFNDNTSVDYNRLIEVKSVNNPCVFYLSQNQMDTAKKEGDKYYLYLVELSKCRNPNYHPQIIRNPAKALLDSDEWLVESNTYAIKHISPKDEADLV